MAQSSITSTSVRLNHASRLRKLPSARASARSRKSAAAPCVDRRVPHAARFLRQSAGDIALPHAGRVENDVLVILYLLRILRQPANNALLQSPSRPVIDVFDTGIVTEPSESDS